MKTSPPLSRRDFFARSGRGGIGIGIGLGLGLVTSSATNRVIAAPAETPRDASAWIHQIADPEIRAGVEAAVFKNLLPSAIERVYAGHFTINADGGGFGNDTTWPGLDSWQMIGPYLRLGRTRMVLDYFEFVRASQRKDGNIPFAIFNGDTRPGGCLRGLKYPGDTFTYRPPQREELPSSSRETRRWVGLFEHWQTQGFPLSTLGPICYLLTAAEIFETTRDVAWVRERLGTLGGAAQYLWSLRTSVGLIGGSGFYMEAPPREGSDGVTQCYAIHAFRLFSQLARTAGNRDLSRTWSRNADALERRFTELFWREDHFGEYVHPTRGLVDSHGLSDVNWAAVAFGVARDRHLRTLWPCLLGDPGFRPGNMPTQAVTRPSTYEPWEYRRSTDCGVEPLNDAAAMGRVWYLEAVACQRMKAHDRLVESARMVCRAAQDGFWRERYHLKPNGSVSADGSLKYCEYAAVLARVVMGNPKAFAR